MNLTTKVTFLLLLLNFRLSAQNKNSNVALVDTTIGGVGLILEPTRPTVNLPNSMVRVFPDRRDQLDDQISYFPLTISSHRYPGLFALMPMSGAFQELAVTVTLENSYDDWCLAQLASLGSNKKDCELFL